MRANPIFCLFFGALLFFGSFTSQMVSAQPSFLEEFGSFGSDDGEFNTPSGLAIDTGRDLLFVADTLNDRIQVIDVNGNCSSNDDEYLADDICFVDEFGVSGTGDGEFDSPTAMALDTGSDLLYIVDSQNDRIQIIDVNGNCSGNTKLGEIGNDDICFVDEFGNSGDREGEFDSPSGLAIDTATDYLYVADTGNDRIQVIDVNGNCNSNDDDYLADDICFVDEFGGSGNGDGEFNRPSGLALHTENEILYVADTGNNLIQIIEIDGNCSGSEELAENVCFVDEFGSGGSGDGEFNSPSDLAIDVSDDILYVLDTDNERIQVIEVDGSCSGNDELTDDVCYLDQFGENGNGDGEFDIPLALVLDSSDDLLYVADTDNNRIQILEVSDSSSGSGEEPTRPTNLEAYPISKTSIFLTWDFADPDEDVTGYKIEAREGSDNFKTIVEDTKSNSNSFVHGGLDDNKTYYYRIYAINSHGTSSASATVNEKPADSLAPAALTATAISPSEIRLSWFPPTSTFGQTISGYTIEREVIDGVYDPIDDVGSQTTTYTVRNLETDKEYTYVVSAKFSAGGSPRSNTASATPTEDSVEPSVSSVSKPSSPSLTAKVISETRVDLTWSEPSDGGSEITGYKIEVKEGSGSYSVLEDNTKNTSTTFSHTNLTPNTKYTYKVYAINAVGVGSASNESSATPSEAREQVLAIKPLGQLSIDEEKRLAFIVGITDTSIENVRFSLSSNAPTGASISSSSGQFTWTPSSTQSGTYTFDVIAKTNTSEDTESITIIVNDVATKSPEPPDEEPTEEPKDLGIAPFVDPTKDPQSYVDRYNNEPKYKEWFDKNYPQYDSIEQAVGLKEPVEIAPFVDPTQDPQYYVDRYNNEPKYKEWFDSNFPEYDSIYQAVGLEEPKVVPPKVGECGEGTKLINGVCTPISQPKPGGGCLIATATYGSEMAPQVQMLREIRDNKVMSTESGSAFMTGFNQFYYSFSPVIADYERENPLFREAVKLGLTPMLSSLSLLSAVDVDSEKDILGYGISIIMLNIGMYFVAPAIVLYKIKKSRLVRF